VANYEYDAYGGLRRAAGAYAIVNPFRFSTKFQDNESGLSDFGRRWYDADTGRWLNRDPLGELGGTNVYAYAANDPVNRFDPDGRASAACSSTSCGKPEGCAGDEPDTHPASQPVAAPPASGPTALGDEYKTDCTLSSKYAEYCKENRGHVGTSFRNVWSSCVCVCTGNIAEACPDARVPITKRIYAHDKTHCDNGACESNAVTAEATCLSAYLLNNGSQCTGKCAEQMSMLLTLTHNICAQLEGGPGGNCQKRVCDAWGMLSPQTSYWYKQLTEKCKPQ
jgi:RHS repeat-associated protein